MVPAAVSAGESSCMFEEVSWEAGVSWSCCLCRGVRPSGILTYRHDLFLRADR